MGEGAERQKERFFHASRYDSLRGEYRDVVAGQYGIGRDQCEPSTRAWATSMRSNGSL